MTYTLTCNPGHVGSIKLRSTTTCVPESLVLFAQILNKSGFTVHIAQGKVGILRPPPADPITTTGWRLTWSHKMPRPKLGWDLSGSLLVVDGEDDLTTLPTSKLDDIQAGEHAGTGQG